MKKPFRDRVAVVTGAASGIGKALVQALRDRGARVFAADINGGDSIESCDVSSAEAVGALAARVVDREGRIDLWINNAGIGVGGRAHEIDLTDWRRVLDVNLFGVIHGVHAVYPLMMRQRAGHIVNVASAAGLAPYPLVLPYTTSKHAVVGLSQALRAEAREYGVRVSVVCPGRIDTAIWQTSEVRGALAEKRESVLGRLPSPMSAERCAKVILRGIAHDRAVIPVALEAHAAWWLNRFSPGLAVRISGALAAVANRT